MSELAWLQGRWVARGEDSLWEETWSGAEGSCLVAATRWVAQGQPRLYELSVIEETPDGVYLRLRHFSPGLAPWASEAEGPCTWRLVRRADRRAEFENLARGFPQRIVYHRASDDELLARLEGSGDDAGKVQEFRFHLAPS